MAWAVTAIGTGGGIMLAFVSPYVGIPIGAVIFIIGIVLLIRAYRIKGKDESQIDKVSETIQGEVTEAFYSGTKTETISGITRASHFIVNVKLALHLSKPDIQLSWIRLCIGGEPLDPIKSIPQIKDSLQYAEEFYELIFEVPVHTFLKGRYSAGAIRPDKDEPEAQIYIKAGGLDWYSDKFSIPPEREII